MSTCSGLTVFQVVADSTWSRLSMPDPAADPTDSCRTARSSGPHRAAAPTPPNPRERCSFRSLPFRPGADLTCRATDWTATRRDDAAPPHPSRAAGRPDQVGAGRKRADHLTPEDERPGPLFRDRASPVSRLPSRAGFEGSVPQSVDGQTRYRTLRCKALASGLRTAVRR